MKCTGKFSEGRGEVSHQRSVKPCQGELDTFFHLSTDLLCIAGLDGHFLRINPAWEKILGFSKEELFKAPFFVLVHPDDLANTASVVERIKAGEDCNDFVNRTRCKDGSYRWISWKATPTPDGLFYSIGCDITEGKQAEQNLRESERFLDSVVDNMPNMVFVKDARDLRYVRHNKAGEELLGYSREALLGKNDHDFFPREEADFFTAKDQEVLEGGLLVDIPEESIQTRYRGTRILHTRKIPVFDEAGQPKYLLGISEDVTERKQAEEALRESEERFKLAVQGSNSGIWDWFDVNDSLNVWWSSRFYELLGYEDGEIEASPEQFRALLHPDDRARTFAQVQAHLEGKAPFDIEYRLQMKHGAYRWFHARAVVKRDEQGAPCRMVGSITDIDERKRAEEALLEAKEAAEAAMRVRSHFLAMMSHEIRTPMNAVIGMTSLLVETDLSDDQRETVEIIRSSGEALLTIINDILDFSKIEAERIELEEQAFGLRPCVKEAVDLLATKAHEKGVELVYHIEPSVPVQVVSDRTRLRQILVNLISNAVKFTDQGRIDLRVRLLSSTAPEDPAVCRLQFSVHDTGIGIDPDQVEQLFKPFVQADPTTTRRYGGTGLGLSICQRLCVLLGGEIWVESEPGVGSTFHFTVMARQAAESDGARLAGRVSQEVPGDGAAEAVSLRILLAEDNVVNQKVILRMLKRLGYEADVVSDGGAAVETLRSRPYDLVLMDVQMPEVDGLEATRRVRTTLPEAHQPYIIAVTANAMSGDRERCLEVGMDAYVSKPIKLDDLQAALKRYLAR